MYILRFNFLDIIKINNLYTHYCIAFNNFLDLHRVTKFSYMYVICKSCVRVEGRKNAIVIVKPTMMIHLPVAAKQEGRSNNWTNDPVQNAVVCSVRIAGTIIHRRSM